MFGAAFTAPSTGMRGAYPEAAGYGPGPAGFGAAGPGYGAPYAAGYDKPPAGPGYGLAQSSYVHDAMRSMAESGGPRDPPDMYDSMPPGRGSHAQLASGADRQTAMPPAAPAATASGPRAPWMDPQQPKHTSPALGPSSMGSAGPAGFPAAGQQLQQGLSGARGLGPEADFPLSQGFLPRGGPGQQQPPFAGHTHVYSYSRAAGPSGLHGAAGLAGPGGMGPAAGSRPDLSAALGSAGMAPAGYGSGYGAINGFGGSAGQLGMPGDGQMQYRMDSSYASQHGPGYAAGRHEAAAAPGYGSYHAQPGGAAEVQGRQALSKEGSAWEASRYRGSMRQGLMAGLVGSGAGGASEHGAGPGPAPLKGAGGQSEAGQLQPSRQSDLVQPGDQYRQYMYGRPITRQ